MALTGAVTEDDLRPVPVSREQFDVLVAAGSYEDQRVELLEGTVVERGLKSRFTATTSGASRNT